MLVWMEVSVSLSLFSGSLFFSDDAFFDQKISSRFSLSPLVPLSKNCLPSLKIVYPSGRVFFI